MRISKYYFDCVCPDGTAFIGYSATAAQLCVRLGYESAVLVGADGVLRSQSFGRQCGPIARSDGELSWIAPQLGLGGVWTATAGPLECDLCSTRALKIRWRCLMPRGVARVELPGGRSVSGSGYAEHLELELSRATPPFVSVQWGRAHLESETLVWIVWRGAINETWAWLNGAPVSAVLEGGAAPELRLASGVLKLAPQRTIEDRCLSSSVPRVLRFPLRQLLNAQENKLLCGAEYHGVNGKVSHGTAISELVTWDN